MSNIIKTICISRHAVDYLRKATTTTALQTSMSNIVYVRFTLSRDMGVENSQRLPRVEGIIIGNIVYVCVFVRSESLD